MVVVRPHALRKVCVAAGHADRHGPHAAVDALDRVDALLADTIAQPRHETVAEYVAKRASVIPLRFGTIYLERTSIEQMLTEKSRELEEIIEHLRGREEWGMNVYSDRDGF